MKLLRQSDHPSRHLELNGQRYSSFKKNTSETEFSLVPADSEMD